MRPLLVGEMPSRSGDRYWEFPMSGAVAKTLCQIACIPPQDEGSRYGVWTWALYDHFECVNAIERHQEWEVRRAANTLIEEVKAEHEVVVLLGRRAQDAYVLAHEPAQSDVAELGFYQWIVDLNSPTARREVAVIPHPSSRNRTYNDSLERMRAGVVLKQAIQMARAMQETRL